MSDASTFRGRRDWMRKQREAGIPDDEWLPMLLAPRDCPYWQGPNCNCACKSEVFKLLPDSASTIGSACGVFPGASEAADVNKCKWRLLAAGQLVAAQTVVEMEADQ